MQAQIQLYRLWPVCDQATRPLSTSLPTVLSQHFQPFPEIRRDLWWGFGSRCISLPRSSCSSRRRRPGPGGWWNWCLPAAWSRSCTRSSGRATAAPGSSLLQRWSAGDRWTEKAPVIRRRKRGLFFFFFFAEKQPTFLQLTHCLANFLSWQGLQ